MQEAGDATLMKSQLRPMQAGDEPFLYRLYASTRGAEMALVDWSDEQKETFLRMQFAAQHRYYQDQFRAARFDVVVVDGRPVGRLYVDRAPDEYRIIDITMLPECRGSGIGGELIRQLLAEANEAGVPVRIHVLKGNPARGLYDRLGFVPVGETGLYDLMEWRSSPVSAFA